MYDDASYDRRTYDANDDGQTILPGLPADYEPTSDEIREFARDILGVASNDDGEEDAAVADIARSALKAPLPVAWKACLSRDDDAVYYFNFETAVSSWSHPGDAEAKQRYELLMIQRKQRERQKNKTQTSSLLSLSLSARKSSARKQLSSSASSPSQNSPSDSHSNPPPARPRPVQCKRCGSRVLCGSGKSHSRQVVPPSLPPSLSPPCRTLRWA